MRTADLAAVADTRQQLSDGRARQARIAAGVRQAELAAALGVHRSAVGHWESGRCVPSAAHALAYGRLLRQLAGKAA